jgi:hypothetical protein
LSLFICTTFDFTFKRCTPQRHCYADYIRDYHYELDCKFTTIEPATKFDLSHWKITVPLDLDNNGKIDEVSVVEIQNYAHPNFFYLDENGGMSRFERNNPIPPRLIQ